MSLFKEKPEAFQVVNIIPGGPAEAAGLKKGDTVTAIDTVPAKQMSGRDAFRRFTQAEGTKVAVGYVRDGKVAQTEVTLRTLLP
jgi:putative serine protease PepD